MIVGHVKLTIKTRLHSDFPEIEMPRGGGILEAEKLTVSSDILNLVCLLDF